MSNIQSVGAKNIIKDDYKDEEEDYGDYEDDAFDEDEEEHFKVSQSPYTKPSTFANPKTFTQIT